MIGWIAAEQELRDKLLEELSYVTGEPTGGVISAECALKVLTILEELGWRKAPAPEWTPGRWYRVLSPDGKLWMETSDRDEAAAEATAKGWPLQHLWRSEQTEWRLEP